MSESESETGHPGNNAQLKRSADSTKLMIPVKNVLSSESSKSDLPNTNVLVIDFPSEAKHFGKYNIAI